uniref:P2X purinoreceptor 7 intracellular domain-containing protein n=1 Tax=Oncorhynchus mykiss TaxID=8022 RepID=A0A8C7PLB9_ONCMY
MPLPRTSPPVAAPRTRLSLRLLPTGAPVCPELPESPVCPELPESPVSQELPEPPVSQELPEPPVSQELPEPPVSQELPELSGPTLSGQTTSPDVPDWCVCHRCQPIIERESAVAMDKIHFDLYVQSRGHLMLANRLREDLLPQGERQEPGAAHKELSNAVYRQHVAWMYGALGGGNRVIIPSCCVCCIQDFFPGRFVVAESELVR